ncbi:hypothetical protein RhiirA1_394842 [Rhizophagus irregularis]|uniref:Uncharacterized protein n=1 Tax=Rhizophagus irregularis TaxID=588596 RepID=A0A2N0RRP7_9GLOM|nr:hypothetical protein RhiirA1_394842 [Rhizophagus irregularis]
MQQYNVTIRVVDLYSFESLALIKAFKKNLAKLIYNVQYAIEGRLAKGERSRLWNKILKKYIDFMNNSKTRLIGMSPARAMTLEEVESKPSSKAKRAIGRHEEIKLKKGIAVRYLLKSGKLEGITGTEQLICTGPCVSIRSKELLLEGIHHNQSYTILRMNLSNLLPI